MKRISGILLAALMTTGISFYEKPVNASLDVNAKVKANKPAAVEVHLNNLCTKPFIPPKDPSSRGDNDFAGHGPVVHIKTELFIKNKSMLYARVTMSARERGGDDTYVNGSKEFFLYFSGFGNEILSIESPKVSTINYTDDDHGEDYVSSLGRVKASDSKANWYSNTTGFLNVSDLVKFAVVVGDTEGQEAGTRTGLRIYFSTIKLMVKNQPPAATNNFDVFDLPRVPRETTCGANSCSGSAGAGLLRYYNINATCEDVWNRVRSVSHAVNWVRDARIANMGMPPSVLRDKLKEWKPDLQLRLLTKLNFNAELKRIIKVESRPVIALVGWGSRTVYPYYAPTDDSYGINGGVLHYVIVEGWDDGSALATNQKVWHIINNGDYQTWSDEYFTNALFWKPENALLEGLLYPQDVHPGNVIY